MPVAIIMPLRLTRPVQAGQLPSFGLAGVFVVARVGDTGKCTAMPIKGQLQLLHPLHHPHPPVALGDVPVDPAIQRRALVIPGIDSLGSDRVKAP